MKTLLIALSLLAAIAAPSYANPSANEPEVDGEVEITLKGASYVKVQVNGEDFEGVEFEKDGKVAIVKGLSLSQEKHVITLIPTESELAPVTVEVAMKEFKKKRKGKIVLMVAAKAAKFEKAAAPAPVEPSPTKAPEPSPAPPQPEDDL